MAFKWQSRYKDPCDSDGKESACNAGDTGSIANCRYFGF